MGVRRKRITAEPASDFLESLRSLPIRLSDPVSYSAVFDLARTLNLTVYDAAYLDLAIREKLALATLDDADKRRTLLAIKRPSAKSSVTRENSEILAAAQNRSSLVGRCPGNRGQLKVRCTALMPFEVFRKEMVVSSSAA